MDKVQNIYCRNCGRKMIVGTWRGDKIEENLYDSGGGHWWKYSSPYNQDTGEENLYHVYMCPMYKRTFFGDNDHEILMIDEQGKRRYGIRVKRG